MVVSFSIRCTLKPESAKSTAALKPAIPPPTTNAVGVTGTVLVGTSSDNLALAIPALISSTAFI